MQYKSMAFYTYCPQRRVERLAERIGTKSGESDRATRRWGACSALER